MQVGISEINELNPNIDFHIHLYIYHGHMVKTFVFRPQDTGLDLIMVNLSGRWFLDFISLGKVSENHTMVQLKPCEWNWVGGTV